MNWRQLFAEQEAAVTAGTLDPESCDAWALGLWPAGFTADVDAALAVFERNIEQTDLAGSHEVWVLIRDVVLSLNAVDEHWHAIGLVSDRTEGLTAAAEVLDHVHRVG